MKKITLLVLPLLLLSAFFVVGQTVTDVDGNEYQTQVIGGQEWMVENLRVSKYRNGDEILTNQSLVLWNSATEGIWANYEDNPTNDAIYGKLYNWYAVQDERGLCPTGWRVPTDDDWQRLVYFIDAKAWGNNNTVGSILKSRRQVNSPLGGEHSTSEHPRWDEHNSRFGTDDYGFGVLPAGAFTLADGFANLGKWAYLWSTTLGTDDHVWVRTILHSHRGMSRSLYPKEMGFSVRCIKGADPVAQVPQVTTSIPTDVTISSAILGGVVTSDGGLSVTDRGVVWSTAENPTLVNHLGQASIGVGVGAFSNLAEGFTAGQSYWVSAYATNDAGTAYGIQKKLDIPLTASLPIVNTVDITDITFEAAKSGGEIVSNGAAQITSRGVVWSTESNPTIDSYLGITSDGVGSGSFVSNLSGLNPETTYYLRAYATNSVGTTYGSELQFETTKEVILYNLTLDVNPLGTGTAIGAGSYEAGEGVALVATPEAGYQFVNWTLEGTEISTSASYTYTMPEGDVTLVANFEAIPATQYSLSIIINPEGTGTAIGAGSYEAGEGVALVATPEAGYQFVSWTLEGTEVSTSASYTYTMPESDVTLVANFETLSSVDDGDSCSDAPTVTDYDGNVYNTVYIGGQCWIRENLKTTHYSNGDPIVKDTDWGSATTGVYGVYSFASISGLSSEQEVLDAYGALYNWYAVDDERGLCPTGWRVATISDWDALGNYVSSVDPNQVGNQLKSCRQLGHPSGGECDVSEHPRWNFNATNSGDDRFNFGGLPAGFRDQSGSFQQVGAVELWWTGTSYDDGAAHYIEIKVNGSEMVSTFRNPKNYGSSVRCIKE
ncbi:MAG: FISUMP domain-containing protein [Tenuifilaceae bacterium]|nr:FISUMP domain-containing protein [Tenuifilaceae bacterium]